MTFDRPIRRDGRFAAATSSLQWAAAECQNWRARQPAEIIEEFYRAALGRSPTVPEQQHWMQQLMMADSQRTLLEDFVWGLLTCQEFVMNH